MLTNKRQTKKLASRKEGQLVLKLDLDYLAALQSLEQLLTVG
jgi:hypothetical protein